MLPKNLETLKNMNTTTGKYAKWFVRVIDPKVIDYSFQSRSEKVNAQNLQCILVSQDPSQYMMGLVPFDFKNRQAVANAEKTFGPNSVWEVTTPVLDAKAKPEYNGCPVKAVLLLKAPTQLKEVTSENQAAYAHPASGLQVALDIKRYHAHPAKRRPCHARFQDV